MTKLDQTNGFTLIELMTTLAIGAIIVTIGLPSLSAMMTLNRQVAHTNDLLKTLILARNESIKRGQYVVVCRSINNVCKTDWNSWEKGWMVFVDLNKNATFDTGETILNTHNAFDGNETIQYLAANADNSAVTDGSFRNYVAYAPDGVVRSLTNGSPIRGSFSFSLRYNGKRNIIGVNLAGRPASYKVNW